MCGPSAETKARDHFREMAKNTTLPRAITNSQTKLVSRDFATNIKECSTLLLGLFVIKYVSKPLQE